MSARGPWSPLVECDYNSSEREQLRYNVWISSKKLSFIFNGRLLNVFLTRDASHCQCEWSTSSSLCQQIMYCIKHVACTASTLGLGLIIKHSAAVDGSSRAFIPRTAMKKGRVEWWKKTADQAKHTPIVIQHNTHTTAGLIMKQGIIGIIVMSENANAYIKHIIRK